MVNPPPPMSTATERRRLKALNVLTFDPLRPPSVSPASVLHGPVRLRDAARPGGLGPRRLLRHVSHEVRNGQTRPFPSPSVPHLSV
jgi:hypothetical protein